MKNLGGGETCDARWRDMSGWWVKLNNDITNNSNKRQHNTLLPCQSATPSYDPGESVFVSLQNSLFTQIIVIIYYKNKRLKLKLKNKKGKKKRKEKKLPLSLPLSIYLSLYLLLSLVVSVSFFLVLFLICLPELPCPNLLSLYVLIFLSLNCPVGQVACSIGLLIHCKDWQPSQFIWVTFIFLVFAYFLVEICLVYLNLRDLKLTHLCFSAHFDVDVVWFLRKLLLQL